MRGASLPARQGKYDVPMPRYAGAFVLLVVVGVWVSAAAIDSVIFRDGDFWGQLLSPDLPHVVTRVLVMVVAVLSFYFYLRMAYLNRERRLLEEKLELEHSLHQAQKMEIVGRLTGGISHEFNNLLTIILGHARRIALQSNQEDVVLASSDRIVAASERAAELVRQLLAFGRKQVLRPKIVDLSEVATFTVDLVRPLIGEDVRVVLDSHPEPLSVWIDRPLVEQMLLNLITNARDAMPDGGEVRVRVEPVSCDGSTRASSGPIPRGDYARIVVSDTGCGIADEIAAKIFDPFFTTKQVGEGTGLGLSMVHGSIQQHDGYVTVDRGQEKGTVFSLYFPIREEAPVLSPDTLDAPDSLSGSGTALVVEDEPEVRRLAMQALESAGYRVFSAGDGVEALETFRNAAVPIDIILTDIVMPNMGGAQLFEHVRQLSPSTAFLFLTGYGKEHWHNLDGLEGIKIMQKPFREEELLSVVAALLES